MFEIYDSTQNHSTVPNVQMRFAVITGDSLYLWKQITNLLKFLALVDYKNIVCTYH